MSGLLAQAEALGGFVWCERRGFEVVGAWAPEFADPRVAAALDRAAAHHAWRADQLWDRLPVLAQIERQSLVRAPAGPAGAVAVAAAGLTNPVARLAAVYRVLLPRLATAYRAWLAEANPLSDGSAMRTVAMVCRDVDDDRIEGEALVQAAVVTSADAYAAGFSVARLEAVFAGASPGITGP